MRLSFVAVQCFHQVFLLLSCRRAHHPHTHLHVPSHSLWLQIKTSLVNGFCFFGFISNFGPSVHGEAVGSCDSLFTWVLLVSCICWHLDKTKNRSSVRCNWSRLGHRAHTCLLCLHQWTLFEYTSDSCWLKCFVIIKHWRFIRGFSSTLWQLGNQKSSPG